jgi:hypothetical protein
MGAWHDFILDNAHAVDAKEAENSIRTEYPHLLHANEHIKLAFKDRGGKGRGKEYFTTHRILIEDGKGIGNKRKNYVIIPYDTILAYSVQTSGAVVDDDCELTVWSLGYPKCSINFSKSAVDMFQIYQLLNSNVYIAKMKGTPDYVEPTPPKMDKK